SLDDPATSLPFPGAHDVVAITDVSLVLSTADPRFGSEGELRVVKLPHLTRGGEAVELKRYKDDRSTQYFQRPASGLEMRGNVAYPSPLFPPGMNLTPAWRLKECPTIGPQTRISRTSSSTSLTAIARSVDVGCMSAIIDTAACTLSKGRCI
ncbi:MAG: hypothetical protein ACXVBO_15840, partial [Isosphaeraceae bacterium]